MKIFPETTEEWVATAKGFIVGFVAGIIVFALALF